MIEPMIPTNDSQSVNLNPAINTGIACWITFQFIKKPPNNTKRPTKSKFSLDRRSLITNYKNIALLIIEVRYAEFSA